MKNAHLFLATLLSSILLISCSPKLTPFTENLHDEYQWTTDELKQIQFYVSKDIVLRRQASKGSSKIERGEIKIIDGRKVEQIVIKKGTPGVFLFEPKTNRFAVSFESGNHKDPYLIFGPSLDVNGRFVLRAKSWDENRGQGKVSYDGKTYYTPNHSAYASLMVDLKRIRKTRTKSRLAKGRKIGK